MATIINNDAVYPDSAVRIENPYMHVTYFDKDKSVDSGNMYFGIPGSDPLTVENQKRVYIVQEDGSLFPIAQPVELSGGGITSYNGSPAKIALDGPYSWLVLDKNGDEVYYSPKTSNPTLQDLGYATIVEDVVTLTAGQTVVNFPNADLSTSIISVNSVTVDDGILLKDVDYTISDGASGTLYLTTSFPAGTLLVARQNIFSSQVESSVSSYPYAYDKISEAIAQDLEIGTKVIVCGSISFSDGISMPLYRVVAGGTGTADGVNFINMTNGNQLQSLKSRNKFQTFTETTATASIASGVLTVDLNQGTVQTVTLTESVTSFAFGNVQSGEATTVTLHIVQDGTGGRGVSFTGFKASGGTAPTITSTAAAESIVVLSTKNGTDWYVFQAGEDVQTI